MSRELKSDRLSFVLDKELTPILDKVAAKLGYKRSGLINTTVINIIMDNVDLLDKEEDINLVNDLIRVRRGLQRNIEKSTRLTKENVEKESIDKQEKLRKQKEKEKLEREEMEMLKRMEEIRIKKEKLDKE